MTPKGILIADLIILALIVFVIYLLLRGKMYVGYGLIWLCGLVIAAVLVSVQPLQVFFTHLVGAVFPVSGLALGAFAFLILVLIYLSVQVTLLGDRVTQLAQQMALKELEKEKADRKATDDVEEQGPS